MTPQITFSVTPPGGATIDLSDQLAYDGTQGQLTITQNFGRQGDTATITVVDEFVGTPTFSIKVLSDVLLRDTAIGTALFAGVITDVQLAVTGPNRNEWILQCTDYTFYADNATVACNYGTATVGAIVASLTNSARCGVTASLAPSGFVESGPTIEGGYASAGGSLSDSWKALAQLAGGQTPFGWYVDENRALHFTSAAVSSKPVAAFSTDPADGLGQVLLDGQFTYEWDATSMHNRVTVAGGTTTIKASTDVAPVDLWLADGIATAWPLRYAPASGLRLAVQSVTLPVSLVQPGGTVPSDQWSVQINASGVAFLVAPAAPESGVSIELWYDYSESVMLTIDNTASQVTYPGPNSGVLSEYISDSSLTTAGAVSARADQELAEYAWPVERVTFTSADSWTGWARAGQLITLTNQMIPHDSGYLDGTFLIIQNTVRFTQAGYRQMQIVAVLVQAALAESSGALAPGVLRPYTLVDVLATLFQRTRPVVNPTQNVVGVVGRVAPSITVDDEINVSVVTAGDWDASTWGDFVWS